MNRTMTKSHSLPPRPPQLRHRASLQETKTKSKSFPSKRRLERHSSSSFMQQQQLGSMERSLLEHVHVTFVKAFVPASKLAPPRYIMRITNTALAQSWEMGRTFRECYELKDAIVNALDHGHLCSANCPWLYMFATHHFPRRHLFRSRSPSVISSRLTELESFVTEVLRMARETRSADCAIARDALPRILYAFLYEGMVFDREDFRNTILEARVSFTHTGASDGSNSDCKGERGVGHRPSRRLSSELIATEEEACSICRRSLFGSDAPTTISPPSCSSGGDMAPSSGSRSGADTVSSSAGSNSTSDDVHSLTTLECGHVFHDDCILQKLNEQLQCPLCVDDDHHVAAA